MNLHTMRQIVLIISLLFFCALFANAQVSTVEYGRNRVQYKNFKWTYYQTRNFNTYYYEGGNHLATFTAQVAEEELSNIEEFVEYGLQRRANIVITTVSPITNNPTSAWELIGKIPVGLPNWLTIKFFFTTMAT